MDSGSNFGSLETLEQEAQENFISVNPDKKDDGMSVSSSIQASINSPNSKAWGSLEPDLGSTPKHIRKVKLNHYNPNAVPVVIPKPNTAASKMTPNDSEFWEQPDAFVLNENQEYFAKKVYNQSARATYLHIGKRTPRSWQRIRFTQYEAMKIRPLIEKVLDQIERHQRSNKTEDDPLEYFAADPDRAFQFDPKGIPEFWALPADIETHNLKVRIQFNRRSGVFEFGFLNPVPEETAKKFKNWAGPAMWFNADHMTAILSFIDQPE